MHDRTCRALTDVPFSSRSGRTMSAQGGGFPGTPNPNGKIGFNTMSMWVLCAVVVGVCYYLEQKDLAERPRSSIPEDVQRVLPSGAWLMADGSIKKPPAQ